MLVNPYYVLPGVDQSNLLLDNYLASAAYSTRLVRRSWTGAALQMSDGTNHADIGFIEDELDVFAYDAAYASGKTKVRTIYDQSGNSLDLQQTDFAKMATLVIDGTYSHRPAFVFSGANDIYYEAPSSSKLDNLFAGGGYILGSLFVQDGGVGGQGGILSKGANTLLRFLNPSKLRLQRGFSTTAGQWDAAIPLNTWQSFEAEYNSDSAANNALLTVNDTTVTETTTGAVGSVSSDAASVFRFGAKSDGAGATFKCNELFLFQDVP